MMETAVSSQNMAHFYHTMRHHIHCREGYLYQHLIMFWTLHCEAAA